jgi:REP element-mobilizing transposase RayT
MRSAVDLQFFQFSEDFEVVQRQLPHWSQAGSLAFITFRTFDSMPRSVVEAWLAERDDWLRSHGVDPNHDQWQAQLSNLGSSEQHEFQGRFASRWHDELDQCHGDCVLRDAKLAKIVADSLLYFDGDRYVLTDFVVMPNHVHLLAAFADEHGMLKQCESWKRFTATKINASLHRKGRFWQQDGFDHLIRSDRQFHYYRDYIAKNPSKANLKSGEYLTWSK